MRKLFGASDGAGAVPSAAAKADAARVRKRGEMLLSVKDLTVSFPTKKGLHTVIDHISFDIHRGEIVGIVGESGSGKSMTSLAIMGLLASDAIVDPCSSAVFNGKELVGMTRAQRREIQGVGMSMVFQEPMTSLNPVMRIGSQVGEPLHLHTDLSDEEIMKRVHEELGKVGLMNTEKLVEQYPHEFSGGMRQRVMIAMATINNPDLIIADEPTTALDVTVQAQILNLFKKIHEDKGSSILFISHDLNVIREVCQRVIVMYKGQIVEEGEVEQVLFHPKHEYTRQLVASMPEKAPGDVKPEVLLHVEDLNVFYKERGNLFSDKTKRTQIIKDISFDIYDGEIFGVVGESGCGKSTLAKAIVGLNKEFEGVMDMDGIRPQMVFQDPFSSLNPAKKVGWIMEEPLRLRGIRDRAERKRMVKECLEAIGLDESYMGRFARELSGGQRQRISIGVAILRGEKFIIADEAVSALDVTVQSQILKLLLKLHEELGLTIMFISHDLNVVRHMCRRVIVMYKGQIVELADVDELYDHPRHPYTRMLFDSVLSDRKKHNVRFDAVNKLLFTAGDYSNGCPFYSRCFYRGEECLNGEPQLVDVPGAKGEHKTRCAKLAY